MKLPVGTPTDSLSRYVDATESWLAAHFHVPDAPKSDAPDMYQAAVLIAADLWGDRQTTGGVQSGGPDMGFYRLGDFSTHVQVLLDRYRKWSVMFA